MTTTEQPKLGMGLTAAELMMRYAKEQLSLALQQFLSAPAGPAWNNMLAAMLRYQQVKQMSNEHIQDYMDNLVLSRLSSTNWNEALEKWVFENDTTDRDVTA